MSNNAPDWQLTESCLAEAITSLGGTYIPASSGSQEGFDGMAKFSFLDNEYLWKMESKCHKDEFYKNNKIPTNIKLADFADKILDILSRDRKNWPVVFCLFSPHRVIDSQLTDRIISLEKNNRLPFKIVVLDFDYLKDKVMHFLSTNSVNFLYPSIGLVSSGTYDEAIKQILEFLWRNTSEGLAISNQYTDYYQGNPKVRTIELQVELKNKEKSVHPQEAYLWKYAGFEQFLDKERLIKCCITKIPIKKVPLPAKSASKSPMYSNNDPSHASALSINAIDIAKYFETVDTQKTELISVLNELKFGTKTFIEHIKEMTSSLKIVIKTPKDNVLNNLPFKFINRDDLNFNHYLSFVYKYE